MFIGGFVKIVVMRSIHVQNILSIFFLFIKCIRDVKVEITISSLSMMNKSQVCRSVCYTINENLFLEVGQLVVLHQVIF